jgi:hypothetical protein
VELSTNIQGDAVVARHAYFAKSWAPLASLGFLLPQLLAAANPCRGERNEILEIFRTSENLTWGSVVRSGTISVRELLS